MKRLQFLAIALVAVAAFTGVADAQRRTAKKTVAKKTVTNKPTAQPLDVRVGREKVSIQLDNVNRFIDVLGPIAQAIETLDQSSSISDSAAAANEANKKKVIQAIRNLKAGLVELESEFRTKPELQKYSTNVQGISDLASRSEDSAIAGKFVAAKEPLRNVAQKLTDALGIIPQ